MEKKTKEKTIEKSFALKLYNLMVHCDRVPKDGTNEHQNYQYATEATLKAKFREGLIKERLFFSATQEEVIAKRILTGLDKQGNEKGTQITTVKMKFEILDVDSSASRYFICYGTGTDNQDKGLYMAITGAIKYFIFSFTLMPSGDDPEKAKQAEAWEVEKKNHNLWFASFVKATKAIRSATEAQSLQKIQTKISQQFKGDYLQVLEAAIMDRKTLFIATPEAN